jgi:aminopeptidase N
MVAPALRTLSSYGGAMAALTREEATARAEFLDITSYDIHLDLTGDAGFTSTTRIGFRCRFASSSFVDISATTLEEIRLDDQALDAGACHDGRFPLELTAGEHELVVRARMAYSHDGEGLHRYADPADERSYLYAMAFLDAAPRIFACFDQPDLKATFRTTLTTPPSWTVFGNGRATQRDAGTWELATTPRLSTYFWTIVAGPYASVSAEHDGIRLGICAMASLQEHLEREADELFTVTGQALDAYHELFGIRYPFGDYHQAFVPEFNAGAMENPGCVTFRDSMVFRSAVTDADRGERARVVVHEMAHMWFGDLVTMQWWDDLWLNESFAEYMAHRVTHEATAFKDSWVDFGFTRKPWGLRADLRTSTHPIAGNGAADSHAALEDFDGISYAKGAAALQQLNGFLGDEIFFAGVRRHLSEHAYANATLDDLLESWEACGAVGLRDWASAWLRTSGPDTLHWEAGSLVRTPPAGSDADRPHRLQLLSLDAAGPRTEDVRLTGPRTSVASVPRPDAPLVIDAFAQTWALVRHDLHTQAALPAFLPEVSDPVTRASLWLSIREGVAVGWIPPDLALQVLGAALPSEDQDVALSSLTQWAETDVLGRYLPESSALRARLGEALLTRVDSAPPGSGLQLAAARAWTHVTFDVERLTRWLGGQPPHGLVLDAELRWALVRQLSRLGALSVDEVDAEARSDRSSRGAIHAARCHASLPDEAVKTRIWDRVVSDPAASNYELYAWCQGFWYAEQADVCAPFVERFFVDVPATAAFRSAQVTGQVTALCYPRYAVDADTVATATATLGRTDLSPGVRRALQDHTDDLRSALQVRTHHA